MKKNIDSFKNFGKNINENSFNNNDFYVGEIISYDFKYIGKIIKIHDGYELLDIILYNPKACVINKPTTVSSNSCIKLQEL